MTETTNERLVLVRWLAALFSRAMVHKHKQTDQLPNTVSLHSSSSSVTVNITDIEIKSAREYIYKKKKKKKEKKREFDLTSQNKRVKYETMLCSICK